MSKTIIFEKMHGIGNDFVLIDNRVQNITVLKDIIISLADRNKGIGFDQLLLVEGSTISSCDAAYRFFNPDGSEAEQCGNGQRCISKYLNKQNPKKTEFCISGLAGNIKSKVLENGLVSVDMGIAPEVNDIIIKNKNCYQLDFGNPHLVTLVDNVANSNLEGLNNKYSSSYRDGINFEIVEIISENKINIRVCERGTGETQACGSGACAAAVAFQSIGKLDNKVEVTLPGGNLVVELNEKSGNIILTGAAKHVFTGEISI